MICLFFFLSFILSLSLSLNYILFTIVILIFFAISYSTTTLFFTLSPNHLASVQYKPTTQRKETTPSGTNTHIERHSQTHRLHRTQTHASKHVFKHNKGPRHASSRAVRQPSSASQGGSPPTNTHIFVCMYTRMARPDMRPPHHQPLLLFSTSRGARSCAAACMLRLLPALR